MKNNELLIFGGLAALLFLSKKTTAATTSTQTNNTPGFPPWGTPGAPRGIRNNNPGNLKKTNINWQGEVQPGTDQVFEQFITPAYGVRALIKDIKGDIQNKGADTISKLIYTYAPPGENNTENYINVLSYMVGIPRDSPIFPTKEIIKKIAQGIANFENYGVKPLNYTINDSLFNEAYSMI